MEQPTRVAVTRAVAAPRLNLLLEETGVTAAFTIEVQIERAEPFVVERTSDDLVRFIRELERFRAFSEPEILRNSMGLSYLRRWWRLLSTALHGSTACALDPSVEFAFGIFPASDAIDIWACGPPEINSLGY